MMERTDQPFGAYHLARLLGRGRFSQVYLAEHEETGQPVALKLFATSLPSSAQPRFLEEGRRLSALNHPHMLGVREVGLLEDIPFLVMDYAPQGNLRMEPGRVLPPEVVAAYVRQIAAALAHAHRAGMLHQNIKPANLFLSYQQHALLSDWGLETVQAHLEATRRDEQPEDIAYLAPEQLRGPAQPASDQYALALVAYEWLTGAPPFAGSYFTLYEQKCYAAPPSLRARVPALSPAVEAVVLMALEKDPAHRFASVQEFAALLERAARAPASVVPPLSKRAHHHAAPAGSVSDGLPDFSTASEMSGPGESLLQRLRAVWRRQE
jgi:serine/threonine protein kinase